MPAAGEAGDVAGVPDQQRSDDRSDAVQVGHGRPGGGDRCGCAGFDVGDGLVQSAHVGDQVRGHRSPRCGDHRVGVDFGQERGRSRC